VLFSFAILQNKAKFIKLRNYKYLLLIAGVVLVGLTFLFGTYPSGVGPQLWLGAKGIYFQPSELLKLLFIIYLAAYFSDPGLNLMPVFKAIYPTLILMTASLVIIVIQRDLGTALIFISIYLFMVFIKYGKKRYVLIGLLLGIAAGLIGYFTIDLVRIRLNSWFNPWLEAQTGSYQVIQSIIAIAAGGLLGTGIGLGRPDFIPISHSDFIFSSIVEETGLIGTIGLLVLYAVVYFRLIKNSINENNAFGRYFSAGVASYLIAQSLLIMGGNIRLLPITGVTLPFMSYGGSSLLISFLSVIFTLIFSDLQSEKHADKNFQLSTKTISYIFAIGITLIGLVTGWWGIIRSKDLQLRADNPRHLLTSRFVLRGEIYDRNGEFLALTDGEIGNYIRKYPYPALSNTIGYINQRFGLSGIERYLDEYLSGFKGYPSSLVWFNYILYDEPPPGRDARLSIDLNLQTLTDTLLQSHNASAVVINAETGEILTIASHPNYDANNLSERFDIWSDDERAPFLNRAIQGAYPAGELLTPLLLALNDPDSITNNICNLRVQLDSGYPECAIETEGDRSLENLIANGCTTPLYFALEISGENNLVVVNREFSLNSTPGIGLPVNEPYTLNSNTYWKDGVYGESPIRISPLRAAAAFSVFSNSGLQPSPDLVTAVNVYYEGWVVISNSDQERIISSSNANHITHLLSSDEISGWEISARGKDENTVVSWYIAGTNPDWEGYPTVVVVLIENAQPETARSIGQKIFNATISN
jgi:cell division protein FtsW (lipid II flippase)